jgi:riboflavin kinase/FMN adenylyltransferase
LETGLRKEARGIGPGERERFQVMQVHRGFEKIAGCRDGIMSIGNFDGVHRGHQAMIASLGRIAAEQGVPAVIFTFDPHPITLLRPERSPPPLTTTERKLELLAHFGVEHVVVYPTDQALLNLSPREFFDQIVLEKFNACGLVEGPNFFFGHDRAGSIETLRELCRTSGRLLEIVRPVLVGDRLVSSTEVRRLIAGGQLHAAGELLGSNYQLTGTVVRGAERGRQIGFPTANLEGIATLLPGDGVYAGRARVGEAWFAAGINIGPNPTFADRQRKVEVHLLDFAGDLYGSRLCVEVFERLRETRQFDGIAALQSQLAEDIRRARALANAKSSR